MDIVAIVFLAIVGMVLLIILRQSRPEMALVLSVLLGVLIFATVVPKIGMVVSTLKSIADKADVGSLHLATLLKIVGVAYIAEFGAQVCRDAQEGAIASKVELAGKVIIMALSIPIVLVILDSVLQLLP
ncbi:MAG TPA: stage III sporulation protein AD [Firmicutes bacterium]|jgi:stage III sporulation protein AD|nr:stage III sporulation protein AD [Bacillota bacterium]